MAVKIKDQTLEQFLSFDSTAEIWKKFMFFSAFSLSAVAFLFIFLTISGYRENIKVRTKEEVKQVELSRFSMLRDLEILASDLRVLANSEALNLYVNSPSITRLAVLGKRFQVFALDRKLYAQIRYIDKDGKEIARINYNGNGVQIIPQHILQNKKERYYFQRTISLKKGDMYLSPLDLNIEQGQLETPHNPMLRLATPIYEEKGSIAGIVILNYKAQLMLQRLEDTLPQGRSTRYSLINANGFWLKSSDSSKDWGFILDHQDSFSRDFKDEWRLVQNSKKGQIRTENGLFLFNDIEPNSEVGVSQHISLASEGNGKNHSYQEDHWYLVAHIPAHDLSYTLFLFNTKINGFGIAGGLFLLIIATWMIAKIRVEKKITENSLRLLSRGLEQSPAAVIITDKEGNISYANPKFEDMTGYLRAEVLGQNPRIFKSGKTSDDVYKALWQTIQKGRTWGGDFENIHKNGKPYFVSAQVSPIVGKNNEIENFIAIQEDVTEKIELQRQLEKSATIDSLTGAFNRGHFFVLCRREISRLARYDHSASLLLFDLDHFKLINDTYGHQGGDQVLIEYVKCIKKTLRDSDIFGRIGGEEFAALLVETDSEGAAILAERLRAAVENLKIINDDKSIHCTVSIGCTEWRRHDKNIGEVIKRADEALYRAKHNGRNRVERAE